MITVKLKLTELAEVNGTPIYAFDTEDLSRNYFDVFYDGRVAKSLPIEEVKKIVKSLGMLSGTLKLVQDVNCLSELHLVRKAY